MAIKRVRASKRLTFAVASVAVAAVTATSAGTGQAAAAPAKPKLTWGKCADDRLAEAKAQCALLKVPLDHAKPSGKQIEIAVSRLKATAKASRQQGPLLLNPGGPGGSGLTLPLYLDARLPADVRATYDLIGFDPRGVGDSRPAVSCVPDFAKGPKPDPVPTAGPDAMPGANELAWLKLSADYASACAAKYPTLLPHLTTLDTVRDMDVLREALGAKQINFYGFSYGTYLGQVYATKFPDKTRRLVFDGVVDPRDVWYEAQLNQDKAFEAAITKFFDWMALHDGVYDLGTTGAAVRAKYEQAQDALRVEPVGDLGPSEWNDVFLAAGYAQFLWPGIAAAFAKWVKGETQPILDLYAEEAEPDDNGYAMYVAVQCGDSAWPRDYATWRKDGFATATVAPFETWGNVWFNAPCITWAAPQGVPVEVVGKRTPSVLLVNTTMDGATPYSGALEVRRRFPNSALVAELDNTTHANSLAGNSCVDNRVFEYLRSGKLPVRKGGPGPDVTCAASPLPTPEDAALSQLTDATAAARDDLVGGWTHAEG